ASPRGGRVTGDSEDIAVCSQRERRLGNDAIRTRLDIDQDRAGLAGVSSRDIAIAMYSGVVGAPIGFLREGRKNTPIVQLMEYGQRETVTDLGQLYVYSSQSPVRVTLSQIARLTYSAEPAVIHRVNQYRAINVAALPAPGRLAEEVTAPLMPRIRWEARFRVGPTGLIVYHAAGDTPVSPKKILVQFLSGLFAAGIVTFVLSLTVAPYWGRVGLAVLLGALGIFTISTIYWNWYGCTNAFFLAQVVDMIVGWALAGAVIARLIPPARVELSL